MNTGALRLAPSPAALSSAPIDAVAAHLNDADRSLASAVLVLADANTARDEGLAEETALRIIARRTGYEARELVRVASAVRTMPHLARFLGDETLSFPQARAIAREVTRLPQADRDKVDALIARRAPALIDAEADQICEEVATACFELAQRGERVREAREVERSFLCLQRRLGGGGTIYGEADEVSFATLCEAIDAAAPSPTNAEADPGARGQQRMDALVGIAATYLGGGAVRPARPLVVATVELTQTGLAPAARVLTRTAGRAPRLSAIGAETLLCEADLVGVLFEHGRPVSVSDVIADPAEKVRTAVVARDGGCRFPGCDMPAAWAQLHHIGGRAGPGAHHSDNLVLLCKRCHDRVHRQRWRITPRADGLIRFSRGNRRMDSAPRARAPARE